jgi:outer membrane protein, heavy metal efflux system
MFRPEYLSPGHPAEFRRVARWGAAIALFSGCVSYQAEPIDPLEVLRELESVEWTTDSIVSPAGAPGPRELASFALRWNPAMRSVRGEIGVSEALLVEAGLLPDPEIGWDGMDALAAEIAGDGATRVEMLAGLGLSIPLPRPGELDAREDGARWALEETRQKVLTAEWLLVREVFLAHEELWTSRQLLEQNRELALIAENTRDYFERAREAGTATAIEFSLASADLESVRVEEIALEARCERDRQALNHWLGLPPDTELELAAPLEPPIAKELEGGPKELVLLALDRRPDLAQLAARYRQAEDRVREEIARQVPLMTIGTGISVVLPIFTDFNRPAIETALARRESIGREIVAAVHEIRSTVFGAYLDLEESRNEVDSLERDLLPEVEESLRLVAEVFRSGEATLLEILSVQRVLIDARTRHARARAEHARRGWTLLAETGLLLGTSDASISPTEQPTSTDEAH